MEALVTLAQSSVGWQDLVRIALTTASLKQHDIINTQHSQCVFDS